MQKPEAHPGVNLLWPDAALEYFRECEREPDAFPTPFSAWNESCRGLGGGIGLAAGWHVVLGADTKQGKTLLALQCAAAAARAGVHTGYLNLEMARAQLQLRLYSQITGKESYRLEPGDSFDPRRAAEVVGELEELHREWAPIWSNRDPILSLGTALEHMRGWVEGWGVKFIVVDYMQLIESPESAGIADEIRKVSAHMRTFAHTTGCTLLCLSQLSNEGASTKPHAGSLYGGRRIAQDADQVLFLDHSRYQRIPNERRARTWLLLTHNRFGPAAEIPIEWNWTNLRAREAMPDEEKGWP